jgi:sporulation protein YlmC with PRC-barrel domain
MPAGFDLRSFFLVAGDGWTAAALPFVLTSPAATGTPAVTVDPAPEEPAISAGTPVYDNAGRRIGEVEGVEMDVASGRITRIVIRRGLLFRTETAIPASVVSSVTDRIVVGVSAEELKKLESGPVGALGTARP